MNTKNKPHVIDAFKIQINTGSVGTVISFTLHTHQAAGLERFA